MRILLVRMGALATLVVLGWIAIAQAQRGGEKPDEQSAASAAATDNPLRLQGAQASPSSSNASQDEPPSRAPTDDPFGLQKRPARQPTASANSPGGTSSPPGGRGQQAGAAADVHILPPSRDQDAAVSGPALTVADLEPSPDDRSRSKPIAPARTAGAGNDGHRSTPARPPIARVADDRPAYRAPAPYSTPTDAPGMSEAREPAPFRPDPFATPAPPMHSSRSDRAVPVASSDNGFDESSLEGEGTGQPGNRQLEGVQTPQLAIHKSAPKEIQVGKPAVFRITLRNTGLIPAAQVEIHDRVPRGTRLLGTSPQAKRDAGGELVWTLGTIRSGEEAFVEMQVMPTTEGEIGSVATVHFGADASVRTVATRPQLVVETSIPSQVPIGEQVTLAIFVSNPGTGVATNVVLNERIPPGLQHPAGGELEYTVGDLKPGESRKLELPLVANRPGPITNRLVARGDGNLRAEDQRELEVLAPQLNIVLEGSKRRFLERQATYQFMVSNAGTAPAKQIELAVLLPPGLKFVSANNAGRFDEATRIVRWRLEELPAKETGSVELVTMPVEPGQHAIRFRATAQKGLTVEKEYPVLIDGIAAVLFNVTNPLNPVEVGGETVYEVHVTNQGSKSASNVPLDVLFPPELKPLVAEGPTRYSLDASRVVFDGLAQVAPKDETIYRIRAKALRPGDLRVRFQLVTDNMATPWTKKESTRVFADD